MQINKDYLQNMPKKLKEKHLLSQKSHARALKYMHRNTKSKKVATVTLINTFTIKEW
jgi:uncharacterized protein YceH (UPF0502 family)